jgi:hypothetical protein
MTLESKTIARLPRWELIDGTWVQRTFHDVAAEAPNPEYVDASYEELRWNPEEGFTIIRA